MKSIRHLRGLLLAAGLALVAVLPFVAFAGTAVVHAAPATIKLKAGGGEPGYAVNVFLPSAATITTGDTVHWDAPWSEPHTVTIGDPPAGGDPTVASNPGESPVVYNGTGYVSSGFIGTGFEPNGPGSGSVPGSFEIQFTKAGTYNVYCAIHPNMASTITVVDSGTVSKQADLDATAASTYATELAAIKAAAAALNKPATTSKLADGSTLYNLTVGAATQNADAMQYFPAAVNIQQGDSVKWTSTIETPHTVTFPPPPAGDPFAGQPDVFPNGYNGGPASSGVIGVGFAGTTYQMKFNQAGTYNYFCLLHYQEGMQAQVVVAAAPATPVASPTATTAPKPPSTGSGSSAGSDQLPWLLGLAGALFIFSGASVLALRRR